MSEQLEKDEVARDPVKSRPLRKDVEEYALEHYRAEVRVKALEVKLLETLLGDGKTADADLRERSEAALKQKLEALRVLCETPSKIVLRGGQWTTVPTGPAEPIADLRAYLRDFDVHLADRASDAPEPTEGSVPA